MSVEQRVEPLATDVATRLGLRLYDVEFNGGILRVFLDGAAGGVTVDELAAANRALSSALDEADPIPGRYQLEVSSPGLERRLRRPSHWVTAIGEVVAVKLVPGSDGDRRVRGTVVECDDTGVVLDVAEPGAGVSEPRRIRFDAMSRAAVVFEWSGGSLPQSSRRPQPVTHDDSPARRAAHDEKVDPV